MLPIEHLLPLRAVNITLQFTAPARPRLFHHLALTAWLRHLVGDMPNYERYITLDAPESGHVIYQKDNLYRFTLFGLNGSEKLLQHILNSLFGLPNNVKIRDKDMPFRDNLIFYEAHDLFTNDPIKSVAELSPYTLDMLQQEADIWLPHKQCWVNWLSPARLLLPLELREKNEKRFCQHNSQVDFATLNGRVYDALAELLRQRITNVPARITDTTKRLETSDLFWMDYSYYNNKGYEKSMGGLLGRLMLNTENMPEEQWLYLVLGQYVGIGQRRSFGWGRYQLESAKTGRTMPRSSAAVSLLELACRQDNLEAAYMELANNNETNMERLIHLREQLLNDEYVVSDLHEWKVKDETILQVPEFIDRVVQQAVAKVLSPAAEMCSVQRGRSPVSKMIQQVYKDGYHQGLNLEVDDFLANVQWSWLYTRLTAFFGDDAVVDLIMGWMSASLDGKERSAGIPNGSPLSLLLVNIMLDDFKKSKNKLI